MKRKTNSKTKPSPNWTGDSSSEVVWLAGADRCEVGESFPGGSIFGACVEFNIGRYLVREFLSAAQELIDSDFESARHASASAHSYIQPNVAVVLTRTKARGMIGGEFYRIGFAGISIRVPKASFEATIKEMRAAWEPCWTAIQKRQSAKGPSKEVARA